MNNNYTICLFVFVLGFAGTLCAQENIASVSAPVQQGRYQLVDLSADTPCACDEKPPRHQQLYEGVMESDMRTYRMYAYRIAIGSPVHGASKLFRALEEDPAVMKISVREWDYMLVFTATGFDKASFEAAAAAVFPVFSEVTPADYFLYKNASLYHTFQQVYPQGYTVSSSAK